MDRKEAYIFAIESEIKSKNLYALLANSCLNEEAKKTFYLLEKMEGIHEEKLIEAYKKEFNLKSVSFDSTMMPKVDIRRNLSDPKAVLDYAVDRELSMADQYEYMAEQSEDPEMKKFFESLYREELDHKELLETELDRIHGTAIWFDESELNGLMEY
ncbi:MAG: ferritin family protein [Candidatus Cloacimonas sp.]|jgi:rubrerythrin|nr:ferritin family protein [Candidatus Cloacimonadota bacterium]